MNKIIYGHKRAEHILGIVWQKIKDGPKVRKYHIVDSTFQYSMKGQTKTTLVICRSMSKLCLNLKIIITRSYNVEEGGVRNG